MRWLRGLCAVSSNYDILTKRARAIFVDRLNSNTVFRIRHEIHQFIRCTSSFTRYFFTVALRKSDKIVNRYRQLYYTILKSLLLVIKNYIPP